jgi:virginiamycin B lyase
VSGNKIGRITGMGAITEFALPAANQMPAEIVKGPDGMLWFTTSEGTSVGRIRTDGTSDAIALGGTYTASSIAFDADGNLWFTDHFDNYIYQRGATGAVVKYRIGPPPNCPSPYKKPTSIIAVPDGALWFLETASDTLADCPDLGNRIGRITLAGEVTEFHIPTADSGPTRLVAGPDGTIWFTERDANKIGCVTPAGTMAEYPVPTTGSKPYGITVGQDAALWFTEYAGNKLGRLAL